MWLYKLRGRAHRWTLVTCSHVHRFLHPRTKRKWDQEEWDPKGSPFMKGERNPLKSHMWNYLLRGTCLWHDFEGKNGLERWARQHVDTGGPTEDWGNQELWEERRLGEGWDGCVGFHLIVPALSPIFFPLILCGIPPHFIRSPVRLSITASNSHLNEMSMWPRLTG